MDLFASTRWKHFFISDRKYSLSMYSAYPFILWIFIIDIYLDLANQWLAQANGDFVSSIGFQMYILSWIPCLAFLTLRLVGRRGRFIYWLGIFLIVAFGAALYSHIHWFATLAYGLLSMGQSLSLSLYWDIIWSCFYASSIYFVAKDIRLVLTTEKVS